MARITKKQLEEENKSLLNEILILVKGEDFLKITEIKAKYNIQIETEKYFWNGNLGIPISQTDKSFI